MEFSRQEYWSGLPIPTPRDLPDPGIESTSLASSLSDGFFTTNSPWEALGACHIYKWNNLILIPGLL